jgi:hypothetical protein
MSGDKRTIEHLLAGLRDIAALKNRTRVKDAMDELAGEPGDDADGFRPIHPRMKRGFNFAADMAQAVIDTMPEGEK